MINTNIVNNVLQIKKDLFCKILKYIHENPVMAVYLEITKLV